MSDFKRSFRSVNHLAALLLLLGTGHLSAAAKIGSSVQNFAQVVVNDGSVTSFSVNNTSDTDAITVSVQLYTPDGSPLASQELALAPGATQTVRFGDENEPLTRGWARLTGSGDFIATEFFQLFIESLGPRIGVLPSIPAQQIKFFGFVNEQIRSGVALHNPSETETAEVTIRLGVQASSLPAQAGSETTVTLGPLESESAFLNEPTFFEGLLEPYEGAVELTSELPVAVTSFIQEETGQVATVAVETPQGPKGDLPDHYRSETTESSPNVIVGHEDNFVDPGLVGATIGGGGDAGSPNNVTGGDFGTVGGGRGNAVSGNGSTVGGGDGNFASNGSTVGGGENNKAGSGSTVGGGLGNLAPGINSTVGGEVPTIAPTGR